MQSNGCQMKHWDLRNAAKHCKYSTKLILGLTFEKTCFWIFSLYSSEFSLYISDALRSVDLIQMYIVFQSFFIYYTHRTSGVEEFFLYCASVRNCKLWVRMSLIVTGRKQSQILLHRLRTKTISKIKKGEYICPFRISTFDSKPP